jgi:molybdate transport system substrate-binding protein
VPAGRYSRDALASEGLWDELNKKFIFGNNVRQVLSYVQRGEADAGFVYRTDALTIKKDIQIVHAMKGHNPVLYPIAVTSNSSNADDAKKFVDYVLSENGQKVLAEYGFSKPQ